MSEDQKLNDNELSEEEMQQELEDISNMTEEELFELYVTMP